MPEPRDRGWRSAAAGRLRWAALALVAFPVGRWMLGRAFPDSGGTRSTIGLVVVLVVALTWTVWELRRR